MSKRDEFVNKALSWVGTKEGSKGHKQIVADYNKACDGGRKADTNTLWCAVFVGAVAQETDNTLNNNVGVPVDYSCGTGKHSLIEKAKAAGIWVENDGYNPIVGDVIIYAWNDPHPTEDNTSGHDHTGVVTKAGKTSFTVTEGNRKNSVSNRTMKVNDKFIRGFITPRFADEVAPAPAPTPTPEPTPAPAPVGTKYKVTGVKTNLRIRKAPTTTADVIGRLANGDVVTVYEEVNGFGKLENCECYTDPTLTKRTTCKLGYASLSYMRKV